MAKFHINKHGQPAICRATKGRCPYGDQDSHFETEVEAQEYADKINEDRFGILNKIDSSGNKVYDIPKNTQREIKINKDVFLNDNHSLKRTGDIWVHLNNEDEVVGTMKDPIILIRENGELLEIADGNTDEIRDSITKLKTLKLMSKFGLISSQAKDSVDSIKLYTPISNVDEYKSLQEVEDKEREERSLDAFTKRIEQRGGNKTSDLFSDGNNEVSQYFRGREGKVNNPEIIHYDPKLDNWEETIPSADNFTISAYQNNNLDIQKINNKWAVIDDKGNIYGRLDEPAVAVNFETDKIESVGEATRINENCKLAEKDEVFTKDDNKLLNRIGMVRLDNKSNDLNVIRNLFEYSWAFKD